MKRKEKQKMSPSFWDYGCIFTHVTFSSEHICMFYAEKTLKTVHRFALSVWTGLFELFGSASVI